MLLSFNLRIPKLGITRPSDHNRPRMQKGAATIKKKAEEGLLTLFFSVRLFFIKSKLFKVPRGFFQGTICGKGWSCSGEGTKQKRRLRWSSITGTKGRRHDGCQRKMSCWGLENQLISSAKGNWSPHQGAHVISAYSYICTKFLPAFEASGKSSSVIRWDFRYPLPLLIRLMRLTWHKQHTATDTCDTIQSPSTQAFGKGLGKLHRNFWVSLSWFTVQDSVPDFQACLAPKETSVILGLCWSNLQQNVVIDIFHSGY